MGPEAETVDPAGSGNFGIGFWFIVGYYGFLASLLGVHEHRRSGSKRHNPRDLDAATIMLHTGVRMLKGEKKYNPRDKKLRVAIHSVHRHRFGKNKGEPRILEQVTPYIGGKDPGHPGQRLPAACGIIGKCARTGEGFWAKCEAAPGDSEAFYRDMTAKWGFSQKQARDRQPDRRSWLAYPIINRDNGKCDAVVFLDSSERDYFDGIKKHEIPLLCKGVRDFFARSYQNG